MLSVTVVLTPLYCGAVDSARTVLEANAPLASNTLRPKAKLVTVFEPALLAQDTVTFRSKGMGVPVSFWLFFLVSIPVRLSARVPPGCPLTVTVPVAVARLIERPMASVSVHDGVACPLVPVHVPVNALV